MRQIYIDLTTDRIPLASGTFIGYMGEHLATELLISIPQAMVDKSDYQVLVFQAGPLVFRSNKVTEDDTKSTYRDGNTIHTSLSKSITRAPNLSLQVECYHENENGETVLIGKTQTVPNLILKPSPEGFPAFGYDGSYEDVDKAIQYAHQHNNLKLLELFTTDEDGTLLFGGYPIGESAIKKYPNPSEFPTETQIGILAYAENDDVAPNSEDYTVQAHKLYNRIRFKHDIDPKAFDLIYDFVERTAQDIQFGLAGVSYLIAREDETILGACSVVVSQHALSLMMVYPKPFYYTKATYGKDERLRNLESGSYIFSGSDLSELIGKPLTQGWSFVTEKNGNYEYGASGYKSEEVTDVYEIDKNDSLFSVYQNVGLIRKTAVVNEELESKFLSSIIEIVPESIKRKGLYIFTDNGWVSFEDFLRSSTRIVSTFADLPEDCPPGTLAHVINDGYQVTPLTTYEYIYKNTVYNNIYFTPYPVDEALLFDFSLHGVYVDNTSSANRVTYKGFFDVQTNLEEKYIVVTVSRGFDSDNTDTFIYSLEDQELIENDKTYPIKKGWNKVVPITDTDIHIKSITDFSELPKTKRGEEHGVTFGYLITDIEINGSPTNSLQNYFLSRTNPFVTVDNGAGLWVKTESEWLKVDNPEEFLMQEANIK